MNEFDAIHLIRRICHVQTQLHDVPHAALDDAVTLPALLSEQYVTSVDTAVEDVHFPAHLPPAAIASRALLAAFSDIAAMGGLPFGCLVAISTPSKKATWIESFAHGMQETLSACNAALLGGNITSGKQLSITTTVFGKCHTPVYRNGASLHDRIYVTGTLGFATLGLCAWQKAACLQHDIPHATITTLKQAFVKPAVPFDFAQAVTQYATAAIDISDGIYADMAHLAQASQVSIECDTSALPIHPLIQQLGLDVMQSDDYQLCFTAPPSAHQTIMQIAQQFAVLCTPVGVAIPMRSTELVNAQGATIKTHGYQHQTMTS